MKETQQEKVLTMMLRNRNKEWWYAYDFIGDVNGIFVGHRAPARISELARMYPEMIETQREGRLHKYRFRFENIDGFSRIIPIEWENLVKFELIRRERLSYPQDSLL